MSENKKTKYEADTYLSGLKMKLVDLTPKPGFNSSEKLFREEFEPILDKHNVVSRLIDHLKERF
jgi:hypothetical protein